MDVSGKSIDRNEEKFCSNSGKVGSRQENREIVGRFSEEVVNENVENFLELRRGGDMIIINR
jgi:hypothetical protein